MSTLSGETIAQLDEPAAETPTRRRLVRLVPDLLVGALLIAGAGVALLAVRRVITRPLWYDEQWRAYYFSLHGSDFWHRLGQINAPNGLLYIGAVKLSTAIFGQYPWAMRLPAVVAVPVLTVLTYAYARRFAGRTASVLVALIVGGSSGAWDQALQLKPYLIEAAATVAVLLLWSSAPAPGQGRLRRIMLFTAAGIISCLSVPGMFLVVPLAVAEPVLLRGSLRRRTGALLEALPALAISVLHTGLFLGAQSQLRHTGYWNFAFPAGRGPAGALRFLGGSTRDLAAGTALAFTSSSAPLDGVRHLGWVASAAAAVVIAGWVMAATFVWRSRQGRQLLVVCGCFLGGSALASELRYWPYGLQRTNIFVIPALAVLSLAGWTAVWRAARTACRARRPHRRLVTVLAGVTLSAMATATCALLVLDGARWEQWRIHSRSSVYGDQLTKAAFYLRAHARPGELVLYGTSMAVPGMEWALGPAATNLRRIPTSDQVGFTSDDDGTVAAALRARAETATAYLYVAKGITPTKFRLLQHQWVSSNWCVGRTQPYPTSGLLLTLHPCADHRDHPQGVRSG